MYLLDEIGQYALENKIPIILEDFQKFTEVLLLMAKPKRILEIGTAIGYSSIFMASVLGEDVKIDTIEIDSDRVQLAWENVRKAGLESCIRIIEGDAQEVLPLLTEQYDFIFMDAVKSKYADFLPHCVRLLKKGGILLADNVLYKGMTKGPEQVKHKQRTAVTGLRSFLKEIEDHEQLKSVILDIGDGVALSVKLTVDS